MNCALQNEPFDLPRPGAPHMDNLIGTMLLAGNRFANINLERIAEYQGFDLADFAARYAHLDRSWEASVTATSLQPNNSYDVEGK